MSCCSFAVWQCKVWRTITITQVFCWLDLLWCNCSIHYGKGRKATVFLHHAATAFCLRLRGLPVSFWFSFEWLYTFFIRKSPVWVHQLFPCWEFCLCEHCEERWCLSDIGTVSLVPSMLLQACILLAHLNHIFIRSPGIVCMSLDVLLNLIKNLQIDSLFYSPSFEP